MAVNMSLLGPKKGEEETFAIEDLVFSTQLALQKAMNRKGVTNKDLAEKLGMSPARVSQVFSSKGPNLTLKTIARIAHALGEDFEFVRKSDLKRPLPEKEARDFMSVVLNVGPSQRPTWKERAANSSATMKAMMKREAA